MTDQLSQRTDEPSQNADDLDTEGHAATWRTEQDPRTGERRLRQGWTPDEPAKPGTSGRVTVPRPSSPR